MRPCGTAACQRIASPCTDSKTPADRDSSDRKLIDAERTLDQQAPMNNRVNGDS